MAPSTWNTTRVKTCLLDCAAYRGPGGTPAGQHIHFPTFSVVSDHLDGTVTIRAPPEYVNADGSLNVKRLSVDHPWFGVGQLRGELAAVVPVQVG